MSRFVSYAFKEQLGDELILQDEAGQERRVGFKIFKLKKVRDESDRFFTWFDSGAWVVRDADGQFCSLPLWPASNDLDALTLFLAELRMHERLFDQLDQPSAS